MTALNQDANNWAPVEQPAPTRVALRGRFDAAPKPKGELVSVDFGDGGEPVQVLVGVLPGGEFADVMDRAFAEDEDGETRRLKLKLYQPALICRTARDPESGQRIWADSEVRAVEALPRSVFDALAEAAARVNRLNTKEEKERGKSTSAAPSSSRS